MDDLVHRLTFMSLLVDGLPADPGCADEWLEAVHYAVNGGTIPLLRFQEPT